MGTTLSYYVADSPSPQSPWMSHLGGGGGALTVFDTNDYNGISPLTEAHG